jgi:hypothetical protein
MSVLIPGTQHLAPGPSSSPKKRTRLSCRPPPLNRKKTSARTAAPPALCPNCGTPCAATDEFCPSCGKNLDELYEQLPDDWSPAEAGTGLQPEPAFLLGWVGATAAGYAIGQVLLFVLLLAAFQALFPRASASQSNLFVLVAVGASLGTGVGLLQWLAVRKFLPALRGWFLATLLGMAVAGVAEWLAIVALQRFLTVQAARSMGMGLTWILFLVGGLVIGLAQWAVLSRVLHNTWVWIVATALSWPLASLGSYAVQQVIVARGMLTGTGPLPDILAYFLGGLLLGVLTGATFVWMVRQERALLPEPEEET